MRGLKPVATYTTPGAVQSHLLQMRGLKQYSKVGEKTLEESHLLQMRGLKLCVADVAF